MAIGADRAIHVEVDAATYEKLEPIHIAKMMAALSKKENVDVVLLGKQVQTICMISFKQC